MNNELLTKYEVVIGLEVHVELKTKSKMFCGCLADYFSHEPNTHTCPVCLGLPGALPIPNKKAIDWCLMIGLALNCKIPKTAKFDRKNYFYPDLPKGYQISQYDEPFCINGFIKLESGKKINIRRVHMEEDTGKLLHEEINNENASFIDFNRSGVPLVEIVTEPDFQNASEVKEYLQKLQQIVRYLDVSNADMEKGDMRFEPNISIRKINDKALPNYKVEVKNINSFKFVEKAIDYEIERQIDLLEKNETPIQETMGWAEKLQKTISQRTKEEAMDYRYFPEPDIPPFSWKKDQISKIKDQIPELPDLKIKRFTKDYSLSDYDSEILTREKPLADYFEEAVKSSKNHSLNPKQIANVIINKKVDYKTILPAELIQQIISSTQTVKIDEKELEEIVKKVLAENPKAVEDYKKGKKETIGFLIGQVKKKLKHVNTLQIQKMIEKIINNNK